MYTYLCTKFGARCTLICGWREYAKENADRVPTTTIKQTYSMFDYTGWCLLHELPATCLKLFGIWKDSLWVQLLDLHPYLEVQSLTCGPEEIFFITSVSYISDS
jgi:hypothetical protein